MKIKFKLSGADNEIIVRRSRKNGALIETKGLQKWYEERMCRIIVSELCHIEHFDFNSLKVIP